jgi:hypothetical protein
MDLEYFTIALKYYAEPQTTTDARKSAATGLVLSSEHIDMMG